MNGKTILRYPYGNWGKFQKVTNDSVYRYVLNEVNIFGLQHLGLFLRVLLSG